MAVPTALVASSAAAPVAHTVPAAAPVVWPNQREGDFLLKDFRFASGETLPELRLHYTVLGTPYRNAAGEIDNAVLLLHGLGCHQQEQARAELSTAIEMYQTMEMAFWLPQAEAALAQVAVR